MNKYLKYAHQMLVFLIVIPFFGCNDEQHSEVTAGFSYTLNGETGTTAFINTSTNATLYLWEFGDGKTSNEINPQNTYAPGTYFVSLTASNKAGSSDVFIDTLFFGGLATNGNFETGTTEGWLLFQNGGSATLNNNISNGGKWSGKLATGGISNPAFKQERIGADLVKAGDVVQIKFDHKGVIVPEGGIFNVLLFGEGASGASFTHVFSPAPVPGSDWATFTGTFTIAAGTDVSEGISFLIEAVCGGAPGCSVTANIDNVTVTLNP
jgi:PKD repeat protein